MRQQNTRSAGRVLRQMRSPRPRQQAVAYVVAIGGTAALTAALLPFRDEIAPLAKGFGFLVVVVAAAGIGGIGPGVVASVLGFGVFNYFFLPPYGRWVISQPEHVVVLFVFLGLSVVISILLGRALERAAAAEAREVELRTLQDLSRELVMRPPGDEAYREILGLVLTMFDYDAGALFVRDTAHAGGLREEVAVGCGPGEIVPEWDPRSPERPPERLPLSIGSNNVGLLVLRGERDAPTPAESRILRAFGDQLALVLERDRLLRTATGAEVYRQTERLRQTLLAAVSHDLRSPLAAIKANVTDLLAEDVARTGEERREVLEAIDSETERLNAFIANLLDMSRIEAGVLHAHLENVDLTGRDRDERAQHRTGVAERPDPYPDRGGRSRPCRPRVPRSRPDEPARQRGRAPRTAPPSEVEVTARSIDGRVTIRIIDHGRGLPPDAREALFHPFYDLDQRNPRLG